MENSKIQIPTKIVVVGHIDHGKSTFIGRFLFDTGNLASDKMTDIRDFAHVMDQFREEREKNITIDTAQTFFHLNGRPYVFVDAPGHKEYLKNMVTGATQADHGLLLVDVAEGIREQTRTHAKILKLIGVRRLAVLVNKMDKAGYDKNRFEELAKKIGEVLAEQGLAPQAVIPVSALEGENAGRKTGKMPWTGGPTVREFIESLPLSDETTGQEDPPHFPIQMIYSANGETVALGRLEKGLLHSGDDLFDYATSRTRRVKQIVQYKKKLKRAGAGESVGLVLDSFEGLERGSILIGKTAEMKRSRSVRAHIFWASPRPLKAGDVVTLECRTQSGRIRIGELRDQLEDKTLDALNGGELAMTRMELQEPIYLESRGARHPFSRFVLFRDKEAAGCGVVETVAASLLIIMVSSSSVLAYIDPGTGMAAASGIGAWIAAVAAVCLGAVSLFFRKWMELIKKRFKK